MRTSRIGGETDQEEDEAGKGQEIRSEKLKKLRETNGERGSIGGKDDEATVQGLNGKEPDTPIGTSHYCEEKDCYTGDTDREG